MSIKKLFFLFYIIFITAHPITNNHKEYIIILDPAGDAKRTGRAINDSFERGLTLQYAEKIKLLLEGRISCKVIISRLPGDHVYDLQNASLSNRVNTYLFINLNFYYTQDTKPTLFLYQFSYGNDFGISRDTLTFESYDQAYKINKTTTDHFLEICSQYLKQPQYTSLFNVAGPYKIPFKPLIGIISPSFAIEVGLKNKDVWCQLVEPLVNSIIAIINDSEHS